jgi:uncharacterized membrane protein
VELVLIIVLTLLMVPLVVFTSGWLRVVLGLLFLLLFPGYALMAAIFPKKDSVDAMERVVLSFGLSLSAITLIGLILNYVPSGIALYPVTASVTLFTLTASTIAIWRRRRLPREERFYVFPQIEFSKWKHLSWLEKTLSIVLLLSIVVATAALVYVVAVPRLGEKFTEFYIPAGRDYPGDLATGEPLTVTLRIVSQEHQDTSFHVEVQVDGEKVKETEGFTLTNQETRDVTITIVPAKVGKQQQVQFLLYRDGDEGSGIYRTTNLWLNVEASKS